MRTISAATVAPKTLRHSAVSLKTSFVVYGTTFHVSHEERASADLDAMEEGALVLDVAHRGWDMVTRVEVDRSGMHRHLYVFWESRALEQRVELLYVEQTETLFVGTPTVSAAIDLRTMEVVTKNVIHAFWAFERKGDLVLELGEMECFLYDASGHCLGSASVDPPYQVFETEKGIRFESELYGTQWLRYPAERMFETDDSIRDESDLHGTAVIHHPQA